VLIINRRHYAAIAGLAAAAAPKEACGLVAGLVEDGQRIVAKIYPLTNLDDSPDHFSLDPGEQFAAVRDMRQNGWTLLGNWHSHPASPARPSAEDIRLAFDPEAIYLIISLRDARRPVLRAFSISGGRVSEQPITIGEDEDSAGS
jgi:proteasome lid subunit RPN8/RPN11